MIPITRPCIGSEESRAASEAVESGWLTQGPRVAEFERQFANYCGTQHAVAVTSGTTALHLSLLVLGIGPGDEVICPSMSYIATANAIRHAGARPVFADIDPLTYNLDPRAAEQQITSRTRAILIVHQIGLPADLDGFLTIAGRHRIPIVEDAACAAGSSYRGNRIGGHTAMACFSFHPRKVMTTGEGGMITTNDSQFAAQLRLLRHHGMDIPDAVRHQSQQVLAEQHVCLGYNYRMTDVQAAIGIEQLKKLDWIVGRRRELAARYSQAFSNHAWLRPPFVPEGVEPNFQSYAVQLTDQAPCSRNQLMQRLLDAGIATRRGIMLAHLEPAFQDMGPHPPLTQSLLASSKSLLLPLYPQMTASEQSQVIEAIRAIDGDAFRTRSAPAAHFRGREVSTQETAP